MSMPARVAAAAVIGVLAIGGVTFLLGRQGQSNVGGPSSSTPLPVASSTTSPSGSARVLDDYSSLNGRILMEHLGNAPDGSESQTTEYHPERRRLYWMSPATMTDATAVEFLPGQPVTGKLNADVSRDGTQVVFMDTADPADVWLANADGTGLRNISGSCTCSELDPAFDPTGTKVVFVHLEGARRLSRNGANLQVDWDGQTPVSSWLALRDLTTGKVTKLVSTSTQGPDNLPYQPSWSPDGTSIVFNRIRWDEGGTIHAELDRVDPDSDQVRVLRFSGASAGPQDAKVPGDPGWSPDGSTIVFTDYPASAMGSIPGNPASTIFTVRADGTMLSRLSGGFGASYMSDGRIVFQNNVFWVMNGDGSQAKPVNARADDLSEIGVGYAYVPHWVGTP